VIEMLRQYVPAWLFALLLIVLSAALAGVVAYLAGGDTGTIVAAVLSSILGVGAIGVKSIGGGPTPPTGAATVTP